MRHRIQNLLTQLTWAQRFMLASLFIIVAGMFGMGWWVGKQIENGVVSQAATNTTLYITSIGEPNLQELATGAPITPEHQAILAQLLQAPYQGHQITAVKVWNTEGRIVYSTEAANIGRVFVIDDDLGSALRGWVNSNISNLNDPENIYDSDRGQRRLQIYSPVRHAGTNEIIGVLEFYQTVEALDQTITMAQRRSWLIVGAATCAMYLLLAGFVRYASDTIQTQQSALSTQVIQLKEVLGQNKELHERVRRAARRTTALNERFLRRISAELHDGPAQDLGLVLLRLEHLWPQTEPAQSAQALAGQPDFNVVQSSLQHALQEIRAISAGMGLPELEKVTLAETVTRAVRAHERRTSTQVTLNMNGVPNNVTLPVKITVYRIIQEALSNAYRHAGGADQQIQVKHGPNQLDVIISDRGPGFDQIHKVDRDEHLGLVGMRERVESLGGIFLVQSELGEGTRIIAHLPLEAI